MATSLVLESRGMLVLGLVALVSCVNATRHLHCPKGSPQSYLWRVRDYPPSYVFGTVHVANDAVWPKVPSNVKNAWRESDAVFAELDWSDAQTQEEVKRCRHLPDGGSVERILPADVFARLKLFMKHIRNELPDWVQSSDHLSSFLINWKMQKKQLFKNYVGDWKRKRPIWLLLLVNDLTREKIENSGSTVLDENLLNVARSRGQVTGALETAAEQCDPLNRLNQTVVIQALNISLQARLDREWGTPATSTPGTSSLMTDTEALIAAYNCGQFNNKRFLRKLMGKPKRNDTTSIILQEFDNLVETSLVVGRNRELANTVSRLLRLHKGETLFFAMGVAHLVGNNSVMTYLKQKGHEVQAIGRDAVLNARPKLKPNIRTVAAPKPPPVSRVSVSSGAQQDQATSSRLGKAPSWKPAFSAVPNDWTSIFTGRLNRIVNASTRKRVPKPINAVTLRKSENQQTVTPEAAPVNWEAGSAGSLRPYVAPAIMCILTLTYNVT